MPSPESPNSNRSLERLAAILNAVNHSSASASEIARRTGLSVSTAHRLALSMAEYGFLRRTENGDFRLGSRFVQSTLEKVALPVLTALRDSTAESAQLWIRRGDERICVLSSDSRQELRASLPPGSRLTLPAGSSGHLLTHDPEAVEQVEAHGWVESSGRRTPGLGSVSAPVNLRGQLIAAVCLAMPLARVTTSPGQDFGKDVAAAALRISQDLEQAAP